MKIIAHRGLWQNENEKNSLSALNRAVLAGYGIETDIRDYMGKLVISHNMADHGSPSLEQFFESCAKLGSNPTLALNVKADGIQGELVKLLNQYNIENYFMFDMSIPEMVVYKKNNMKFFTRHSDIEWQCVLYEDAEGVWLDSFYEENWLTSEIVSGHLAEGKNVCIISPEIHGFSEKPMWKMLKEGSANNGKVMLCTDMPKEAEVYFNGEN